MSVPAPKNNGRSDGKPPAERHEEMHFRGCPEPLLGVEVEMQIVDRETGDLAPGSVRILKTCEEEGVPGATAELMQSMIEVKTDVCRSVDEVRDQVFHRVKRVRNIATSLGFELAMGGTHPFHRTSTSTAFPGERYEKIMDRLAWLAYQRVMFGLHVHVGMPSGDMAIGVINMLTNYIPHLIALSASSPFWQGVDTGLMSSRTALYRLLPHAGLPQYFSNWREFRRYCKVMMDCKTIESYKDIYWDIRPRPDLGTIEFRVCDMPMTITETLRLVALMRCLSVSAIRLLSDRPRARRGDIRRHWIAVENKWLATRYGLNAMYIRTPSGKRRSLTHDTAELIEHLLPIAREAGDEKYLAGFRPVDKLETGAVRQRKQMREAGSWRGVVDDAAAQLARDLEQAPAPAPATAAPTSPAVPTTGVPSATGDEIR